jgi:hypothetical protein
VQQDRAAEAHGETVHRSEEGLLEPDEAFEQRRELRAGQLELVGCR